MQQWQYAAQKLADYIEKHACENITLHDISRHLGYSPYYCSEQFHRISGMTIREYMQKRRLTMAASDLREGNDQVIEIALKYGFSDQSAFTRAFKNAYGIPPLAYRKRPVPLPLTCKKMLLTPSENNNGGDHMSISKPFVRTEYIPAHKYLGVYRRSETKNGIIYPGHDCDLACGIISGFRDTDLDLIVTRYTAGWQQEKGERKYFFGTGVPADYKGDIPEGFELRGAFPGSYYLVFGHQPFDYPSENGEVMKRVEDMAWSFDPASLGFAWNEELCQDYQRHYPEVLGYQVLRAVKKL